MKNNKDKLDFDNELFKDNKDKDNKEKLNNELFERLNEEDSIINRFFGDEIEEELTMLVEESQKPIERIIKNEDKKLIQSFDQNKTNNILSIEEEKYTENNEVEIFSVDNEEVIEKIEYDEIKIKSLLESAFYVVGNEGISINDLKHLTGVPSNIIRKILKTWTDELDKDESRGISIKNFGEKWKFFSKSKNREDLSKLITIKYRNPLSSKVMETLAIIAYNQPCTKSIIEDIRLKDPTIIVQKLLELNLINEAGRAEGPGRPILYTVSSKFYDIFGIKNVSDLPTINLDQPFQDEDISFFDTTRFNE